MEQTTVASAEAITPVTTEPKAITVRRSELAMMKGLGKSISDVATYYGITASEAKKLMIDAGLVKARTSPAYVITYINDIA